MASAISFDKPSFMVDSREREPGALNTIEDFDIRIELPKNNKFNQVSISTVIIPKSYYNITDRVLGTDTDGSTKEPNNNVYSFNHNQFVLAEGTSSGVITLPAANYNSINFPVVMKDLLETASTGFGNNFIYDITYPDPTTEADTRKWTFTVSNNGATQPIFYFPIVQPINKPEGSGARNKKEPVRITEIMGFNAELNNGQRVFSGNTLTSDNMVDFELTKYIVIKSNISLDQGNQSGDNAILGTIPVTNVPDGGVINYELQQLEDESKFLANNRKNIYSFSLWDDHDEPVNLNGINWFVKLFVYEYNPFFELAINDIRIRQLQLANGSIPSVQREVNQPPPTE